MQLRYRAGLFLSLLLATACSHHPAPSGMKVGAPYEVEGKTYYPEYDPGYDETGMASWYGPGFHGKHTANGEVYNQNALTAAHPTLPLPSLVRVTNLRSGKSLIVRVNDRGPFKRDRIIDLSKKSAQELGITSTAEVRVQYLKPETEHYIATGRLPGEEEVQVAQNDTTPLEALDEPQPQIVEASTEMTHAGQTVSDIAPVTSVDQADIDAAPSAPVPAPKASAKKLPSVSLVRNAWADDVPPAGDHPGMKILTVGKPKMAEKKPQAASLVPLPAAPGAFSVQVGAFSSEANARTLVKKLSPAGAVSVDKIEAGAKTLWRVRVGPFAAQDKAEQALKTVQAAGLPDARVVHL